MRLLNTIILIIGLGLSGCASHRVAIPTMDIPAPPTRPAIKSTVIVQNSVPYIGYTVPDALKLYEYLLEQDSYAEKLRYRIGAMNEIIKGK